MGTYGDAMGCPIFLKLFMWRLNIRNDIPQKIRRIRRKLGSIMISIYLRIGFIMSLGIMSDVPPVAHPATRLPLPRNLCQGVAATA